MIPSMMRTITYDDNTSVNSNYPLEQNPSNTTARYTVDDSMYNSLIRGSADRRSQMYQDHQVSNETLKQDSPRLSTEVVMSP